MRVVYYTRCAHAATALLTLPPLLCLPPFYAPRMPRSMTALLAARARARVA